MDDVVIMTMSEFGRMAKQNGNGGTDHGHAGALFVIGGTCRDARCTAIGRDSRRSS